MKAVNRRHERFRTPSHKRVENRRETGKVSDKQIIVSSVIIRMVKVADHTIPKREAGRMLELKIKH